MLCYTDQYGTDNLLSSKAIFNKIYTLIYSAILYIHDVFLVVERCSTNPVPQLCTLYVILRVVSHATVFFSSILQLSPTPTPINEHNPTSAYLSNSKTPAFATNPVPRPYLFPFFPPALDFLGPFSFVPFSFPRAFHDHCTYETHPLWGTEPNLYICIRINPLFSVVFSFYP